MTTGSAHAALSQKQLIGFQDLGTRGFSAIRASNIEATQARWDVDGVFNTKLTIDSPGASQIRINGASKATDGLGHVIQISLAYKNVAQFQNTNAVVYHVGFMYAEIPGGLRINPRTGKPQFDRYVEEVGFAAAPTSVTDNGNGTITFNVNSVTEAAVSNAGRLVRVYKVVPADGATTMAIALEECTVSFGANNSITTVGKFGQTSVSTAPGDYIVVCMGPRVARNTDLSTVSGVVYVGTVTGNGGTPVTFSNTNQTLLKTFQDASQIVYTPALWLAPSATNVQLALDALVSGLQASTPNGASAGGARIGLYAPDWTSRDEGGVGNVVDGTFTTAATLTQFSNAVNNAIRKRWTWKTKNDGNNIADSDETSISLANQVGAGPGGSRPWWLRTLANASTTPYSLASDTGSSNLSSHIYGEYSDQSQASPHLRRTRLNTTANRALSGGKWQRIWLDMAAGTYIRFGGPTQRYGLILEDWGANGGGFYLDPNSSPSTDDCGMFWRNGVIKPKDETTKHADSSFKIGVPGGTTGWLWAVFENLLVYGPSATQTSPAGAGFAISTTSDMQGAINATTVSAQSRPLVFRNTVVIMQRTTDATAVFISGNQPILFENCRFFGMIGKATGALLVANPGANVQLINCIAFDPEGSCVDFAPGAGIAGLIDNCVFVAGIGGSNTITAPKPFYLNGNAHGFAVRDSQVILGSSAFRTNATATTTPLVKIGNTSAVGKSNVVNLQIKVEGGADLGWARLFEASAHLINSPGTQIDGLFINCNALKPNLTQTNVSLVKFTGVQGGRMVVNNLWLGNIGTDVTTPVTTHYVEIGSYVHGRGWAVSAPNTGNSSGTFGGVFLWPGSDCSVFDIIINNAQQLCCTGGVLMMTGSRNVVDGFRTDLAAINKAASGEFVYVNNGNENIFTNFNVSHLASAQGGGAFTGRVFLVTGTARDNAVRGCKLSSTNANSGGVVFLDAGRRNSCTDCNIHYNGSAGPAIDSISIDGLVDSIVAYRSAGATAAVSNTGAGAATGSVVTSTTL